MAQAASVDPSERLPWLSEPAAKPAPRRSPLPVVLMALAAGAAGAAGWTALQRSVTHSQAPVPIAETVRLPPPVVSKPVEEPVRPAVDERQAMALPAAPSTRAADPAPPPRARVAPAKKAKARSTPATRRKKSSVRKATSSRSKQPAKVRAVRTAATAANYDPRAWNSGVQGRIIQLGAFRSPAQANGQWNRVYYRYPLLRPLPPRVVRTNIRGRTYYRLQLGTFSHAHSELLCQRLRIVGEGCIVLGLNRRRRQA